MPVSELHNWITVDINSLENLDRAGKSGDSQNR